MPRRPLLRSLLVAALLAGPAATAHAARPAPPPSDPDAPGLSTTQRLEALVARVKAAQAATRTLQAAFVQRKQSEFLQQPEEAHGRFLYQAPDRIRWEYETPKPILVLIHDKEMLTWYRDLKQAQRVKIGRYTEQVFRYMGAGSSIDSLYEYFKVTVRFPKEAGEPYRLDLDPRYERMKKKLQKMTVWIDRREFLPTRFEYVEADGDTTEYEMSGLERNAPLPADAFDVQLPADVQVKTIDLDRKGAAAP